MPVHRIRRQQQLAASLDAVWDFFSSAKNLQAITPAHMRFRITSGELPAAIYPGQIITYTVAPVMGIPLFWMTEITHVVPKTLFVDEQRRGPYAMWHHEHHFEERDGGVLMTDLVHYELPLGPLGSIAHALFIKKQLTTVFDFRREKIAALFA